MLNEVLRNIDYTPVATVYVALYTVAPTRAGGGTEVAGGSYSRTAATFGAPSGSAPTEVANTGAVTFPTATASWGTVVAFGILDASVAGNLLYFNNLTASKTIDSGDTASFAVGDLVATED